MFDYLPDRNSRGVGDGLDVDVWRGAQQSSVTDTQFIDLNAD